jgi:predicted LPLAT superfamily acyltransferase
VLTVFGLFSGPNRYELLCEPFCDVLTLDREARDEALRAHAQRYASRLEEVVKRAPYNWFNFYDFWRTDEVSAPTTIGSGGSR